MRVGALLVRERWALSLGDARPRASSPAPHLRGLPRGRRPARGHGACCGPARCVVNSRCAVALPALPGRCAGLSAATAAWRRCGSPATCPLTAFADGTRTLEAARARAARAAGAASRCNGVWCDAVWDVIGHAAALLDEDLPQLAHRGAGAAGRRSAPCERGHRQPRRGSHAAARASSRIVVFDRSAGPVLLRRRRAWCRRSPASRRSLLSWGGTR